MHVIGLVAEYNPFHNGHLYQIQEIKKRYPDSIIIALISSSFTQRGDISILPKWDKTQIALDNNIDIVVEFPFAYATQSSDIFGSAAITILEYFCIDTIIFGTETDNIDIIKEVAHIELTNEDYDKKVKKYLAEGLNYPTATNRAIYDITGHKIDKPNDLLALSYIKKIFADKKDIDIVNIPRTTSYHGNEIKDNITSASNIRKKYLNNEDISAFIPYSKEKLLKVSSDLFFPYIKYNIILNKDKLANYQTVDEGIENRLLKSLFSSGSYEELIFKVKSKRYTYNRISRLLLHILIGLTKEECQSITIDYLRILGFSSQGQKYLNTIKKNIPLPIITGYKKNISKLLDIELRATEIYSILTSSNLVKEEYRKKPIIK